MACTGLGGRCFAWLLALGLALGATAATAQDEDFDDIPDPADNCPLDYNPSQDDSDGDLAGDACDCCPEDASITSGSDPDTDGWCEVCAGAADNCPADYNPGQLDSDADGAGDACDCCPEDDSIISGTDTDGDGICEVCTVAADNCSTAENGAQSDLDEDALGDACDNCPADSNLPQSDADLDAAGDVCDVSSGAPDPPAPIFTSPAKDTYFVGRPAGASANGLYVEPRLLCDVDNGWYEADCGSPEGEAACIEAGGNCLGAIELVAVDTSPVAPFVVQTQFFATEPDPANETACGPYTLVAVDLDPGVEVFEELEPSPPEYLDEGNNPFASEGWSGLFFPPSDGLYCLRVEMYAETSAGPSLGGEEILIQVDSQPSVPQFVNLGNGETRAGLFPLSIQAPDDDPVSFEISMEKKGDKNTGFSQTNLGGEKQTKVGSSDTEHGTNNYCAPTAVKNALHRLAIANDKIFPQGNIAARNLRMAKRLSELMKTKEVKGTLWDGLISGIRTYLTERGVGCKSEDGYTVTPKKIAHEEGQDSKFRPFNHNGVTWNWYEREMRKGEAVVVMVRPWYPGPDRKYGHKDDQWYFGHMLTGKGGKKGFYGNDTNGNSINQFEYVDPATGKSAKTKWVVVGQSAGRKFSAIHYRRQLWIVYGMVSISPKKTASNNRNPQWSGTIPNTPENPSAEAIVPIDTTAFEEGVYMLSVNTLDSQGNMAKNEVFFTIDQSLQIPSLTPWGLALLASLLMVSALWLRRLLFFSGPGV